MSFDTATLLSACQAGDRRAWSQLFGTKAAQLFRWGVLLGLSPADAEDAAQEVLALVVTRIDSCPGPHALDPWLFQITRRVAANARRRRWWRALVVGDGPLEPAFEHSHHPNLERELAVRSCLALLSPAHVEVLVLMDIEGHTRDEAALALGVPVGTVASRRRLAIKAFRQHWEERFELEPPFEVLSESR